MRPERVLRFEIDSASRADLDPARPALRERFAPAPRCSRLEAEEPASPGSRRVELSFRNTLSERLALNEFDRPMLSRDPRDPVDPDTVRLPAPFRCHASRSELDERRCWNERELAPG